MDYRKSHLIFRVGMLGGAVMVIIGCSHPAMNLLLNIIIVGIGLACILFGTIQAIIFCRCPECGKRLVARTRKPDYCPGCGYKLAWKQ